MSRFPFARGLLTVALLSSPWMAMAQAQQGVTKTEVVLGTIQDLSGPIASFGKEARNGMTMRIDEANAAGGVNGRKIRLIVEDSGYDTKRAVLAAQKLAERDKVFAAVGSMGTAIALTTQMVFIDAGVVNALLRRSIGMRSAGRGASSSPRRRVARYTMARMILMPVGLEVSLTTWCNCRFMTARTAAARATSPEQSACSTG